MTTTVRKGVDTWLDSTNTTTNYGDAQRLGIKSGSMYPLIWFAPPFPPGANVSSAILTVYAKGAWGVSPTLSVRRVTSSWKASRVTYATTPTVLGTTGATLTQSSPADATVWSFDVTNLMQNVADGSNYYGFRLETTDTTQRFLYSLDALDYKPTLAVTFTVPPDAPTDLVPSGNQAVSSAKPVVRFTFNDYGGDYMSGLQVQINATNVWTAPTFDSGILTATEPELDLSGTAYAGLANTVSAYWRVRAKDSTGLWSPWSDASQFHRDNKGTLTLSSPSVSNVLNDFTPPIVWSLAGETQTAWRAWILRDDDPTTVLADSGKTTGTATQWTVPKGALKRDDITYRARVRTWDSKDRANTAGDPDFTAVERAFTFSEDGTVVAVTAFSIVINSISLQPHVTLSWTSATAPDSFNIMRDGDVVDSKLLPSDLLVSGTTYQYVDKEARRGVSHVWKVQRVVNGKASASNPTATGTLIAAGIWLADNDRNIFLFLTNTTGSTWGMGEAGDTFNPLGSATSVRLTQGIRGWEGNVTGTLVDYGANTADGWADNAMNMRSRAPRTTYTLHVGREAMKVRVFNFQVTPQSQPGPSTRLVSFDFLQVSAQRYDPRI